MVEPWSAVEHEQRERRRVAALVDEELGIRDIYQPTYHRTSGPTFGMNERSVCTRLNRGWTNAG